MRLATIHSLTLVHRGLFWLVTAWLVLVVFTGGEPIGQSGFTAPRSTLEPALLAWLGMWLAAIPVRQRHLGWDVFHGHQVRLLFVATLAIYLANGENQGGGDSWPARYLPFSILRELDFDLDEFPFLYESTSAYYLAQVGGRYVSQYPVAPALLALPFYVLPVLGGVAADSPLTATLEKLAAAVIVALSVAIFFLAARRLCDRALATVLALTYGLATSSLSVSSQALWQHGPSQLALTTALYALLRGREQRRWLTVAGLALGFAVTCRPTDALVVLPLAAYALWRHGKHVWRLAFGGAPPLLFQVWYNARYFDDPLRTQFSILGGGHWLNPLGEGLADILLSPARGLFVYSPILVLGVVGAALTWTKPGQGLLRSVGLGTAVTVLVYAKWNMWWGGHSYGPRLLADLTPGLVMLIAPLEPYLKRSAGWRGVYVALLAGSVLAHGVGVFWGQGGLRWNRYPDVDRFPARLWDWKDAPPLNALRDIVGRGLDVVAGRPTSRRHPEAVQAVLSVSSGLPAPLGAHATARAVQLTVTARNSGQVKWLSTGRHGQVVLAWGFVAQGSAMPAVSGRIPLRRDLHPGGSYEFALDLDLPQDLQPTGLDLAIVVLRGRKERTVATTSVPSADFSERHQLVRNFLLSAGGGETRAARRTGSADAVRVILGAASAQRGSRLAIGFALAVPSSAPEAELYMGAILPDGRTVSWIVGRNELTAAIPLTAPHRFRPLLLVGPGTILREPAIVDINVPSDAPEGQYQLFAAVLRRGAIASKQFLPDDFLALDVKPLRIVSP